MSSQKNGASVLDKSKNYRPSDREPFMNERQRAYFREKLLAWKEEILKEARETLAHLQAENENHPDLADRASSETDRAIELRARDRQRKLIAKIDSALSRLEDGTYGYCEETGEPIALKRLERARLRRSRSRRRSVTSVASASIGTSENSREAAFRRLFVPALSLPRQAQLRRSSIFAAWAA
jgi:DnaK suppressor protein